MHNGVCVPNNAFFRAEDLQFEENGLHCLLATSENPVTSAQVKWLYPDGTPVDCSKIIGIQNDIHCSSATNNNGSVLYISNSVIDRPLGIVVCTHAVSRETALMVAVIGSLFGSLVSLHYINNH